MTANQKESRKLKQMFAHTGTPYICKESVRLKTKTETKKQQTKKKIPPT